MTKLEKTLKEFSDKGILTEESVSALIAEFDAAVDSKVSQKLTEEASTTLKKYKEPVEVGKNTIIGWKYDTNGNKVVVYSFIKNGKESTKSSQLGGEITSLHSNEITGDKPGDKLVKMFKDFIEESVIEKDVNTNTGNPVIDALSRLINSIDNSKVTKILEWTKTLDETQLKVFADQLLAAASLVDAMSKGTTYTSPIEEEISKRVEAEKKLMQEQVQKYKEALEVETKEMINTYLEEFVMPNVDRMIVEESIKEQQAQLIEESIVKDEAIETLTNLTNKLSGMIKKDPVRLRMIEEAKNSQLAQEKADAKAKAEEVKRNYIVKELKKRV